MSVFKFFCLSVLGTLINPQQQPGKSSNFHVHCLASNKPIQIKDPFDHRLLEDKKFIAMEWYQLVSTSSDKGVTETLLIQFLQNKTHIYKEKFSVFDIWGLQVRMFCYYCAKIFIILFFNGLNVVIKFLV